VNFAWFGPELSCIVMQIAQRTSRQLVEITSKINNLHALKIRVSVVD
jgi:hypothetical protein